MSVDARLLPPRLRATVEAGVVLDDVADSVCAYPLGALEVTIGSTTDAASADGLFGPAGYVLVASDDDGTLMTGIVQAVPLQIAMLVGLGPRPVADDREIALGRFSDVAAARAARGLPEAVAAVLAVPDAVHWTARATWASPDGPAMREVTVIDGGNGGLVLWTPMATTGEVALLPCDATAVWRVLCALLPYPSEVV